MSERASLRIPLFFLLLVVSLVIPDGIQQGSDFYWPLITILTLPLWKETLAVYKKPDAWLLVGLIISLLMSAIYSWSPGYSISGIIRLLTGLTWLTRFSTLNDKERRLLPRYISVFIFCAVSLSIVPILIPAIRDLFPQFSLVRSPEGHLPMVYVVLPLLPVLLFVPKPQQRRVILMAIIAAVIGTWISVSRVALLLCALLFSVAFVAQRISTASWRFLIPIIGSLILLLGIVSLSYLPSNMKKGLPIPSYARWYVVKEPLTQDQRIAYVQQTIQALRKNIFFGTGVQTFSLISKRFGTSPFAVSTYSHSIILTILAETGLLGFIVLLFMGYVYGGRIKRTTSNTPLILGLLIALAFGLIETSFDHYPVWIICMMLAGMTSVLLKHTKTMPKYLFLVHIALALSVLSWFGSDIASGAGNYPSAFLLAPYRETKAIQLFHTNSPISPSLVRLATLLFPESDQLYIAKANRAQQYSVWQTFMTKAMSAYPTNSTIQWAYLTHIAGTQSAPEICTAIRRLATDTELPCLDSQAIAYLKSWQFLKRIQLINSLNGQSKFLYALGLDALTIPGQESQALAYWIRARDLAPHWGYFHIEAAALVRQMNNDKRAAIPLLLYCLSYWQSYVQCDGYIHDIDALPRPGSFEKEIMSLP